MSERSVHSGRHPHGRVVGFVDVSAAASGASTGFSILLLGSLTAPLVAALLPSLGSAWNALVAAVAFSVAGFRIGSARAPALHGAVAALSSYLLMMPLVMFTAVEQLRAGPVGMTLAGAVTVGAVTGLVSGKRRDRFRATAEPPSTP